MCMAKIVHSYGVIPLKRKEEQWQTLLVQHRAGHWGFPKGHPDEGETPEQTAARELLEETQLSVQKFLELPPISESYVYKVGKMKIQKQVTYFMGEVSGECSPQPGEIIACEWFFLDEAKQRASYPETRRIVELVNIKLG